MRKTKQEKKIKNKGKTSVVYKIIAILQILVSLGFFGLVVMLNILPLKYLAIGLLGIGLIDFLMFIILFKSKLKKGIKKFFSVISFIIMIVFCIISLYLYKTYGIITGMIDSEYKTYNYSVIVLNNSKYSDISDLKDKKIGYYETKGEENTLSLEKLNSVVTNTNLKYTNLNSLGEDLLNKEIPAIVLEDSYKETLSSNEDDNEYNTVSGFSTKTKVIYTFTIKIKADNTSKGVDVTDEVFNIYISGIDTYGKVSSVSRSDVNIIVTVNPKTKQILMNSIPRDYYVQLHDTTGYKDKLTHAGIYGTDKSIKTIEDLLEIDINYYFKVNFTSLIDIINALDGVDVYSNQTFTAWNGYHFTKGYNHVNGKQALAFVRERKTFNNGDRQRGINQQALIDAMLRRCMSKSIITKYNKLLNSVKGSIITNMPTKTMLSLIKMQLNDNAKWTITSNNLDGSCQFAYTYSYNYQQLSVMVPSEKSVNNAKDLIKKVFDGEVLEASYDSESSDVKSVTKYSVAKKTTTTKKKTTTVKEEEPVVEEPVVEPTDPVVEDSVIEEPVVEEPVVEEPVVEDPVIEEDEPNIPTQLE